MQMYNYSNLFFSVIIGFYLSLSYSFSLQIGNVLQAAFQLIFALENGKLFWQLPQESHGYMSISQKLLLLTGTHYNLHIKHSRFSL